jgi:hypothetical protein
MSDAFLRCDGRFVDNEEGITRIESIALNSPTSCFILKIVDNQDIVTLVSLLIFTRRMN